MKEKIANEQDENKREKKKQPKQMKNKNTMDLERCIPTIINRLAKGIKGKTI